MIVFLYTVKQLWLFYEFRRTVELDMLERITAKERPMTRSEIGASITGAAIGAMSLYFATLKSTETKPLAEVAAESVSILGFGTAATLLCRATLGSVPEIASAYAKPRIEVAKTHASSVIETAKYFGWCVGRSTINLATNGFDTTEYLAWCAKKSTSNVAHAAIMSARPALTGPTL